MPARDDLISATAELLWERGYTGTSPALILKRSGAGQGSMYHHFSGKADLARAAMERIADQMRAAVEEADDPTAPPLDRVRAYLDLERDPMRGCRLGRLVQDSEVVADPSLRDATATFFRWLEEWLTELLAGARADGSLVAGAEPREIASMVVAVVQGGYVLARALDDESHQRAAVAGATAALHALTSA